MNQAFYNAFMDELEKLGALAVLQEPAPRRPSPQSPFVKYEQGFKVRGPGSRKPASPKKAAGLVSGPKKFFMKRAAFRDIAMDRSKKRRGKRHGKS